MNEPERQTPASILPVLVINFIGTLGFSIVLPFLVFLVNRYGGNAFIYGLVGATYPAMQMIGAPILGRWSDRIGRKRVLLLSQAGTLLSWVVFVVALYLPAESLLDVESPRLGSFALTLPLVVIFLSRALDGLTGGNVSVANAYLADVSREADRAKNFGKMGISSNLGFILGPAIASALGATIGGDKAPVFAALAISAVATVVIAAYLPESRRVTSPPPDCQQSSFRKVFGHEHRDCVDAEQTSDAPMSMREAMRLPQVGSILVLYFVVFLGFNFFYTSFPIHAAGSLQWSLSQTGVFFSVMSVMMVIAQAQVLPRASKRFSDPILMVVGNVLLAFAFLAFLSPDKPAIYAGAALFAFGNGIMWPSTLSILSKAAGEEHQGTVQGVASSIGSFASILGLLAGGLVYEAAGSVAFVASTVLFVVSAVLCLPLRTKFT